MTAVALYHMGEHPWKSLSCARMGALMLPLVIVNPTSGGGSGASDWPSAASALASHFGPFERRFTERAGDGLRIAREEALKGRPCLLTFGGDGTVSEVARGILDSGRACELGVLPHGTGSDFIRTLGIPGRLADAARSLRQGHRQVIDVGRVALDDGEAHPFINAASFGLSGDVAYEANRSRKSLGGTTTFALATLRAAAGFRAPDIWLALDEERPRRLRVTTVSFHNGRFFGGGMKMAPEAKLTDGKLDAVIVQKLSLGKLVSRSPLLYGGLHLGMREVERRRVVRARAFCARPEQRVRLEIDGESLGFLPATFEVVPKALAVRLPRDDT